jgi:hypothetical protein
VTVSRSSLEALLVSFYRGLDPGQQVPPASYEK